MKVRRPLSTPCKRNGEDNRNRSDWRSQCKLITTKTCKGCFKYPESQRLKAFLDENPKSSFKGCQSLEQSLIDDFSVNYGEHRETSGLQVLFNGIEAVHDLQSEIFNGSNFHYDIHEHLSTQADEVHKQELLHETKFVRRSIEELPSNDKNIEKREAGAFSPESIAPQFMHLNPGMMSNLWGIRAKDLFHSRLITLWSDGFFEHQSFEIKITAYSMMKGVVTPELIELFWDGDASSKKAKKLKHQVRQLVKKRIPERDLKFEKFLKSLNSRQRQVLEAQYYNDDSKTQVEKAESIGLKLDNYKYHLKQIIKALEKIYPEYEALIRKNKANPKKKSAPKPLRLFSVIKGKRVEIPHTKKKMKPLSKRQIAEIKAWSYTGQQDKNKNLFESVDPKPLTHEKKLEKLFEQVKYEDVI